MALHVNGSTHLIPAYYSFYRPRKDERLSWPSWLTRSGWFTHTSDHPSAAGRAQDRESSPARPETDVLPLCHATNLSSSRPNRHVGSHNITIINKTKFLNDTDFIIRMLYIDILSVITHCAYVVCYFRDVYPFIYCIIAMYVHHLGFYCILFRRF